MEHLFWGTISLSLLGVLFGLLAIMVVDDVRRLLDRPSLRIPDRSS